MLLSRLHHRDNPGAQILGQFIPPGHDFGKARVRRFGLHIRFIVAVGCGDLVLRGRRRCGRVMTPALGRRGPSLHPPCPAGPLDTARPRPA